MASPFEAMMNRVFTKRLIMENTWLIEGVGCYSYLLIGNESAILIDSGMSRRNLKEYCEEITKLPIKGVINTHGHFDHTGGNGWFDKAFMHPLAVSMAKKPFEGMKSGLNFDNNEVTGGYSFDFDIEKLEDGQVIELGGRPLEIIYIGAHSPGSIAILDKKYRLLFTGDELESGQVLLFLNEEGHPVTQTVENHQKMMKKLKSRMAEFDFICPSHNGSMMHNSYVDIFIQAEQEILGGAVGIEDISSPTLPVGEGGIFQNNEFFRRYESGGANICYDTRRVKG